MDRLELRQTRYFLVVAETLHFGLAAAKVGLSQADLIFQIREIERAAGCALFHRGSEISLTLTPAGAYLFDELKRLQTSFDEALQAARLISKGKKSRLRIGYSLSAMYTPLPLTLSRFRSKFPEAEVELIEVTVHEFMALLLEGNLEAAVVRDAPETYGLRMESLVCEPFLAALPQEHALAAEKGPLEPAHLQEERLILLSPRNAWLTFERTMSLFRTAGFTPEIAIESTDWTSALSLVGCGFGVSLVPASVAQLNLPGIVFRPLVSEARSQVDLLTANHNGDSIIVELQRFMAAEFRPLD